MVTPLEAAALSKLGVDRNIDGQLDTAELNETGKSAVARGFVDPKTSRVTAALAMRALRELDGRFDWGAAFREAGRGMSAGFVPLVERPLRSAAVIGLTFGTALLLPQVALALSAIGLGLGVTQLARGGLKVARAIQERDGDLAEDAFRDLGGAADLTGISTSLAVADAIEATLKNAEEGAPPSSNPAS